MPQDERALAGEMCENRDMSLMPDSARKTPPPHSHLPIQHPDFRYSESLNPYWTKLQSDQLKGFVFSDNDTETHRGRWRTKFGSGLSGGSNVSGRPLHVEIGCNTGHVVREWAARNPDGVYIGLDWKFKIIFRGVEKAATRGLRNLIFFRAHAERLHFMFGPAEIDHLYLYFPDPWPKKAHWKHRFLNVANLRLLAGIVRPGGTFHIKTDHPGYFEWMEAALAESRDLWDITSRTTDLHKDHPDPSALAIPDVTLFERLFIKDGIKINSLWLKRVG